MRNENSNTETKRPCSSKKEIGIKENKKLKDKLEQQEKKVEFLEREILKENLIIKEIEDEEREKDEQCQENICRLAHNIQELEKKMQNSTPKLGANEESERMTRKDKRSVSERSPQQRTLKEHLKKITKTT
ncbi:hypothetical protein ILUMI_06034 [Ignelater luminosus]|uniref:Uncharacterized protein n=1 Tax=Ignelater luminosus TaxID=2038154 RepID=A0A8K0GCZ7_IGNLU|nr:hypothetical protein ILUMI_06034 [Ignelater luminosus]